MLSLLLLACAPGLRMPGPLTDLGSEVVMAPTTSSATARAKTSADTTKRAQKAAPEEGTAARSRSGDAVAQAAVSLLGRRSLAVGGERYRYDCSGFAAAALAKAGFSVSGSAANMWAAAVATGDTHRKKRPAPGDLAFFDHTYDRNGNGRNDDALSHVAVVESIEPDGTISMVHLGSSGIVRLRMNLLHPHETTRDGATINEALRARSKKDPPGTEYLAAELWVGFTRPASRPVADAE